jgi:hypothetical protein
MICRNATSVRYDVLPVRGLEMLTGLQLGRWDPMVQIRSVDWTNWFWVVNLRALRYGGDYGRVP